LLRDITKRIKKDTKTNNDNLNTSVNVDSHYLPICPEHLNAVGKWYRDYKELLGPKGEPNYQGYYARFKNESDKDYRARMNAAPYGYYYDGCMMPDLHPDETPEEEEVRIAAAENSKEFKF
jgi:hypothetical protein